MAAVRKRGGKRPKKAGIGSKPRRPRPKAAVTGTGTAGSGRNASTGRTEERLLRAQAIAHVGDWEWEVRTNAVHWSDELYRIYGFEPRSIQPDYGLILSKMHPESKDAFLKAIDAALREDRPFEMDYRFFRKDGSEAVLHTIGQVVRDAAGAPMRMHGIVQDITERKRAEEAAAERGALLQQIMDTTNVGIAFVDGEGRFTLVNRHMADLFGCPGSEMIGSEYVDYVHPSERETARKGMFAVLNSDVGTAELDRRYVRKDGTEFWGHLTCNRFYDARGTGLGLIGAISDITGRKRAEDARRESEERFRSIFARATDGILILDVGKGSFVEANDRICRMMGYGRDDLLRLGVGDIHPEQDLPWVRAVLDSQLRGEVSLAEDIPVKKKDGSVFFADINASTMAVNGRPCLLGIFRDITERKQADAALRERERQLAESQRIAHVGSWEHNLKTGEAFWSDELFRLLGLDPARDRADFRMFFGRVHPEDQPGLRASIDRTLQEHVPFSIEYRFVLGDGSVRHIHARAELHRDKAGEPVVLSGTAQDITERKRQEAALAESEANYRSLFDSSSDGILILGFAGNILDANRTAYERLGYTREEFLSLPIGRLTHPSAAVAISERMAQVREKGNAVFESGHVRKDGSLMPVEVNSRLLDYMGKEVFFSVVRDISERKHAEDALWRSRNMLGQVLNTMPQSVYWKDRECVYLGCNDVFARMVGLDDAAKIVGKTDFDLPWPRSEAEAYRADDQDVMQANRPKYHIIEPLQQADGSRLWIDTSKAPLVDREGKVFGVLGVFEDISERKRAEEKIRQSEEFIRSMLDTVDEGFIVIDRDYRIVTANKAYCEQAGLPCEAVIGSNCFAVSHRTMRPCFEEGEDCAVRHVFAAGEPHSVLHKHLDRDGQVLYVETKAFPIRNAAGEIVSAIETINNITEKHLLEEERLKTQKLESIGTLAGGIAHDFNNLLQGVFGYISMAKLSARDAARRGASLDEAEKALHLAVKLTNQLLTFSKGGKPLKRPTDLRPVIAAAVRFALSGSRSTSVFEADDDLWHAEADDGQISQVVQNIALNADQAMPLGGTVRIAARNVVAPGSEVPPQLPPGMYVKVVISDTGIGIPAQYLPKIFDPYFTTKEKGSGLGLATAYSIVRNHGGTIDVRSEVGNGATFLVYLPAALPAVPGASPSIAPAPGRRGRVLLMDDEEMVRRVTGELLAGLGQEVEFARDGAEAIEKYRASVDAGRPFDIVILDLTVRGGMGGDEAAQKLRNMDGRVKLVVSSGYSDDAVIAEYREHGFNAFLKKPYDIETLNEVIGSLLR